MIRFIHAADIHLGNQQYYHQERYNDFFRAFDQVARTAIESQAQVCVVAGDLFDKSVVDPESLLLAERILSKMWRENIRVIAITGNHDRPRYNDPVSWLSYLHHNGYLTLLDRSSDSANYLVEGAMYLEVEGVRFIGVPWFGASTSLAIKQASDELPLIGWDGVYYTVLIMHARLDTEFPDMAGSMRMSDLLPLRSHVQYIATGHLHKPYVVDAWVHNPGAIENCAFDEETFRRFGKGGLLENQKPEMSRARQRFVIEENVLKRSEMSVYDEYIDVLTGTKVKSRKKSWKRVD